MFLSLSRKKTYIWQSHSIFVLGVVVAATLGKMGQEKHPRKYLFLVFIILIFCWGSCNGTPEYQTVSPTAIAELFGTPVGIVTCMVPPYWISVANSQVGLFCTSRQVLGRKW